MGQAQAQDIIDWIIGRGNSAPDAFVQAKWPIWMRLRPRGSLARRDAMLSLLGERAVVPRPPQPSRRRWPHWYALLCWQMGPEPAHDQRWQRRGAAVFSAGLHAGFVLLLVWVALVRSTPPASEPQQRVALRFISAGDGHVQGDRQPQTSSAPAPAASAVALGQTSATPDREPAATAASAPMPVAQALPPPQVPAPLPAPGQAVDSPASVRAAATPMARAQAVPAADVPVPMMPVPERELAMALPPAAVQEPAVVEPEPALAAPLVRQIAPRAVDYALEAEVTLPVVERELEMRQRVDVRPTRLMPLPVAALPQPEIAVPERSIALREAPPAVRPMEPEAMQATMAEPSAMAVREREIAPAQSAPPLRGVRQAAGREVITAPAVELAVAEREISPPQAAPTLRGLQRTAPAAAMATVSAAAPMVRERDISPPTQAPAMTGLRPGQGRVSVVEPRAMAAMPAVAERELPTPDAPAGQGVARTGAGTAALPSGGASAPVSAAPAAGSGQDWARSSAGSDDWRRAGPAAGSERGLAASGVPAGLRAADLPPATAERGAPGGENDQWTRQRLEAGGTWLRLPPPGHAAGRFDRYWVPNESLLAQWVRNGVKNVDIPLPGGSGSISCVISLLQLGGGCGVTDPNMQEQPAQARAAPDIPFKPARQNDSGSP